MTAAVRLGEQRRQQRRHVARAVEKQAVGQGAEVGAALPGAHHIHPRGGLEVELTARQVAEDGGEMAEVVGEEERQRRDLLHPLAPVQLGQGFVSEEEGELDIGIGVALAAGEGAVHHRRPHSLVRVTQVAHPLDQALLR